MATAASTWPEADAGEKYNIINKFVIFPCHISWHETYINCDTVKCRYEHLDPETELRLATDPTTEEEKKREADCRGEKGRIQENVERKEETAEAC